VSFYPLVGFKPLNMSFLRIQSAIAAFQEWFLAYIIGAMYPGVPFQRKMTALKLYTEFLDSLAITPVVRPPPPPFQKSTY